MRQFVIGLFLICSVFCAKAQKMEAYFINMPDDVVVQLEEAWRKDLVDLYHSGKTASLENTMQGKSVLQEMTDDYLLLQSTEYSTVELKLLPLVNNTHVICMIETVYAPVADSRVSFFTTEWQALPAGDMFRPVADDWFWNEETDRLSAVFLDVKSKLDIHLMKYCLDAANTTLTAEYTTPQYLDNEYQEKAKPLLKSMPKVYEWKSGRFE